MRFARTLLVPFAFSFCTALSSPVLAAPGPKDMAEARALDTEAKKATKEQRFEDAVTALRRADELAPTPQRKLDLARALIGAGHLVEASTILNGLESTPGKSSFLSKKVQAAAKKLLGELEERIPWVQVTITGPNEKDLSLTLDEQEFPVGMEMPIDPGEHVVVAKADGWKGAEKKVTIAEGKHEHLRLTLVREQTVVEAPPPVESSGGSKVPAVIAFGVGAAGIGVGTVFGVLAFKNTADAKDRCSGNVCPDTPSVRASRDAAVRDGNISTIAFVAGGVGVAAGVVLLLVSSGSSQPDSGKDSAASIQPWIGPLQLGATGRF